MPARHEHENKAQSNSQLWASFDFPTTPYRDWVVAIMFYESVHWIEAFLATKGLHSSGHPDRARTISRLSELRLDQDFVSDYGVLRTESENARYYCYQHTTQEVTNDLIPAIWRIRAIIQRLLPH